MDRNQRLKLNTYTSLLSKIVILFSGLILPRLILANYGSEVNGLVNSVTQFLSIITFLDLGVGSVVQSALYKPLAQKDNKAISHIITSARRYFRNIALILLIYVFLLIVIYPQSIENNTLNVAGTMFLIIAISINQFSQYFFGVVNELLLNADQKSYIQFGTEIIVVILNLIISIILISNGFEIYTVKFFSGLIYLFRPLFLTYYVNKNYSISYEKNLEEDPLPQKWHGVGQHIAYSIQNSTDIVVLTIFSTLESVSIYSVYKMIANALRLVIQSFTVGLQSYFGEILVKENYGVLIKSFLRIEWIIHNIAVYLYSICLVMITNFVLIYTSGVNDVNYEAPLFSVFLLMGGFLYSIRTPYQAIVFAAGHFKETQLSSFIEAITNILLSIVLVNYLGLVGVALASFIAMLYRTLYLANYLSNNILKYNRMYFIKQIFVDMLTIFCITLPGMYVISLYDINSITMWAIAAMFLGIYSLVVLIILNIIFYKSQFISLVDFKIK